ncbi:hypothetical protein OSB04_001527 [Centaurea solstitialis]|uniref:FRIGIDA-like protein n=1 Tax=Centaurea solstitialis TaxID=347529 RepID=A0AA38U3R9_9ASTR|nr:hypothetical protein OSB04_001527 [Centaurea solstitialis]
MSTEYPESLNKFFNELETRRTLLTTITETHNKLINNFISLDETLTKKSQTLDTQMQNFKKHTEKTMEALQSRENDIPQKEVNLAGRVQNLKDSGIRYIEKGNNLDPEDETTSGLLRIWFRRMDSTGLVKFLLAKRKESVAVRAEIVAATEEAVDLLGFVLDAVEEFVELKLGGSKVKGMADRRWACGILIQAGLPLRSSSGITGVATSVKERARKVLEVWKGVLGGGEGSGGVGSGEATMFLQMVIGFGLKSEFDEEFLKQLVMEFAGRREMAKLAVALGFGDKMKDMIEELVKTGKEIEAVYFASEAGLTDQFSPVPLLKSSIKNFKKYPSKDISSMDDINNELSVIRTIMKCIEDHKLESHFTGDNLQKRVNELEKIKSERKRSGSTSTSKPSSKRHRNERGSGGGIGSSRPPKSVRLAMAARQRNYHPALPTHQPARYSAPYSYTNPSVYESTPNAAAYGVAYGGYGGPAAQSPARYGAQYANPAQDYGGYDYGAASAPLVPSYPATYQH